MSLHPRVRLVAEIFRQAKFIVTVNRDQRHARKLVAENRNSARHVGVGSDAPTIRGWNTLYREASIVNADAIWVVEEMPQREDGGHMKAYLLTGERSRTPKDRPWTRTALPGQRLKGAG